MIPIRAEAKICHVCGAKKSIDHLVSAELIQDPLRSLIVRDHPDWLDTGFICKSDVRHYRVKYLQSAFEEERGEVSNLERAVMESLRSHEMISKNIAQEFETDVTIGQRLADRVADIGGSWLFIVIFLVFITLWISLNVGYVVGKPFDPYPFILLNLLLSCVAALQAPIIMMSQNRLEAKDRLRAEHDYQVNLKAELEVQHLNSKMDQLLMHQWQRLLDIQRVQLEVLEELAGQKPL